MPDESIGISVAFDMDAQDVDRVVSDMSSRVEKQFAEAFSEVEQIVKGLQEAVRPLHDMVNETRHLANEFQKIKDHTEAMRQNVSSTRLQTGGAGGGYGSPGVGSFGSAFGGVGSFAMQAALPIAGIMAGGGLMSYAAGRVSNELGWGDSIVGHLARNPYMGPTLRSLGLGDINRETYDRVRRVGDIPDVTRGVGGAPIEENNMRLGLMGIGAIRGIGQGPLGMFANISGTARGWEAGTDVANQLMPGNAAARMGGGFLGAQLMPGLIQNYAQEAMGRYTGYLQTSASMSTVGMHGGNLRQIMGLRPAQFGYGPGDIGPEFSALYKGFGGTELTSDTLRTAMAYSRRYGTSMGEIGQAVGGLSTIGGGGQFATAGQNEAMLARVMTDAVSAGFGRRLPEYAQAVGAGVQSAMQGPALITQSNMGGLISGASRLTGLVASANDMGLEGAGRLMRPLMSAPQNILQGMFTGRGDPYQMAMYWGHNRGRFNNDPMAMMEGLEAAAGNPFGAEALEFQRGPLQQILSSSPNRAVAVQSLQALMPDISFTGARQVIERGMDEHGGNLAGVDMQALFTGVETTEVNEAEETRDAMRDIQQSGETIMRDQLGAMRANAAWAQAQHGLSAAMAADARIFHEQQIRWSRVGISLMRDAGVSADITALGQLFNDDFMNDLNRSSGNRGSLIMGRIVDQLRRSGVDIESLNTDGSRSGNGRGVRTGVRGNVVHPTVAGRIVNTGTDLISPNAAPNNNFNVFGDSSEDANTPVREGVRRNRRGVRFVSNSSN